MRRLPGAVAAVAAFALLSEIVAPTTGTMPSAPAAPATFVPMALALPKAATAVPDLASTSRPGPAGVVVDPATAPPVSRPPADQPVPKPKVTVKPKATRAPRVRGKSRLTGLASWYCRTGRSICHYAYPDTAGFDAYAAAGPRLRAALGSRWRGRVVLVDGVRVKLVDWCQCHKGERGEKLIDVYYDVFRRVGGEVTIAW